MTEPQVFATAHRCPRCGSTLISNGRALWCSFVGDVYTPSCMFGLDGPVARCERCGGPEHEGECDANNPH